MFGRVRKVYNKNGMAGGNQKTEEALQQKRSAGKRAICLSPLVSTCVRDARGEWPASVLLPGTKQFASMNSKRGAKVILGPEFREENPK